MTGFNCPSISNASVLDLVLPEMPQTAGVPELYMPREPRYFIAGQEVKVYPYQQALLELLKHGRVTYSVPPKWQGKA